MRRSSIEIINLRRELAHQCETATREWLAARSVYRRLHEAKVKDFVALRDAARRLDVLERGRAALLRDLKALSD